MKKNNQRLSVSNERGSIVVAILVALAMTIGFLGFHYSEKFALQKLDKSRVIVASSVKAYMMSVHSLLISQRSLIRTLKSAQNGTLWQCINDVEFNCTQTTPSPLTLLNELGNDTNYFWSPGPSNGLDINMNSCTSYPSLTCPFRYELNWYADCGGGGFCAAPDIYVEGHLLIAPAAQTVLPMNSSNYNLLVKIR